MTKSSASPPRVYSAHSSAKKIVKCNHCLPNSPATSPSREKNKSTIGSISNYLSGNYIIIGRIVGNRVMFSIEISQVRLFPKSRFEKKNNLELSLYSMKITKVPVPNY